MSTKLTPGQLRNLVTLYHSTVTVADSLHKERSALEARIAERAQVMGNIRRQLANHTAVTGPVVVKLHGSKQVAYVPQHAAGYTNPEVYPAFHEVE
jgi:poly(3-hydroxybutyrate) depolymerase